MVDADESLLSLHIDGVHRLVPAPLGARRRLIKTELYAVFGWSARAAVLATTDHVAALTEDIEVTSAGFAPEVVPPVVERVRAAVERDAPGKRIKITGGPSFVFPSQLAAAPPPALPLIASDSVGRARARQLIRPSNWEVGEWDELLSGKFGSWAMVVDGDEPVSICHTPGGNDDSVECGAWTRASHRRQGLAAATVRAWWALERLRKRVLFYSTDHDNWASRGVARTLGLTPISWLWTVR